jgi:hypothetical protein
VTKTARNVGIIAAVALVIIAVPGADDAAALLLGVISLAFLAAISWFAYRLYMSNRFTIWSLSTAHRALLYGAIALAFMTLVATPRLWETGAGTAAWFGLLGASSLGLYYVWLESRRYRI